MVNYTIEIMKPSKILTDSKNSCIKFTNIHEYSMVKEKIGKNEKIIGKLKKFSYSANKESIIGNKHVYITNLGRVIGYDEGGVVADKMCYSSDQIKYKFIPESCEFELSCNKELSISSKISIGDYLNLDTNMAGFIPRDYNSLKPILLLNNYYVTADVKFDNNIVTISQKSNKNYVSNGLFSSIWGLNKNNNIDENILIDLRFVKNIDNDLKWNQWGIEFFSEQLNETIYCHFIFFDEQLNKKIEKNYSQIDSQLLLFNNINEKNKVYCESIYQQKMDFKSLHNINYKDLNKYYTKALIVIDKEKMKVLDYNNLSNIVEINLKEAVLIKNPFSSDVFIDHKTGILSVPNTIKFKNNHASDLEENCCFLIKNKKEYLFKVNLSEKYFKIYDYSGELLIQYNTIKSIELIENMDDGLVKVDINIDTLRTYDATVGEIKGTITWDIPKTYMLVINKSVYFDLLETYLKSKINNLCDLKTVYYEWAKTLRDINVFYFFALPAQLKSSLDKLTENTQSIDSLNKDEKINIINMMYTVLKQYRNLLVEFSGYFSLELYEENAKDNNMNFRQAFTILQKEMTIIYNQINTHISSCIGNLNYLTSYIYPELDIREALNKKIKKRALINSAAYATVGVLTGGFGFFMIAGMQGMSILDSIDKNKIIDNMEEEKINIFLNNSINEFDMFINVMMPKYIGDINRIIHNFVSSINSYYTDEDINFLKISIERNKLFLETPIAETVLKKKQILVDFINNETRKHKTNFLQSNYNGVKKLNRAEYHKQLGCGK